MYDAHGKDICTGQTGRQAGRQAGRLAGRLTIHH